MASTWGRSFSWPNTWPARSGRRSPSRAGRAKSSTPSGRRSLRHSLQPPAFSLQPAPETRRNTEGRRSFRQEDKVQTAADEKWIRMLGSGSGLGERAPSLSATPTRPRRPGKAPQPAPCARKSATRTAQKTALCAPASTQEVSESENRPATRGTAHSEVQVDDRGIDRPIAALHFLLRTGDSRSGRRSFDSKHLPSPARRGSRSRTASPPASLAIRKAPSASVESIQPRPPQPCEVGRPKGRRRKNRRQSHRFFLAPAAPGTPTRRHALGRLPTPPPLPENLLSDCTENCPLRPLRAPRRFGIRKWASNSGHSPLRG